MKRKLLAIVAMMLALSMALTACGREKDPDPTSSGGSVTETGKPEQTPGGEGKAVKVDVLGSKAGSSGFTDEGIAGADRARAELDAEVDYIECEENTAYETNGRFLSESGEYDLIVLVSSYANDLVALFCDDYPDQKYSIIDCKLEGKDNVRSVAAINGEQAFLSGVLCGLITTGEYQDTFPMTNASNTLCYAGGMDQPTSREGAAGFMAGAKYVNPDVEVLYTIVGGYSDPATAKEITLLGNDKGADVATGNCGSGIMGILEACRERSMYYIATSPSDNDVNQSLCCSVKKTDVMVYNEVKTLLEGNWTSGHNQFGIASGVCDISFEGTLYEDGIPAEIQAVIDQVRQDVIDGKIVMPADVNDVEAWAAENQYQA